MADEIRQCGVKAAWPTVRRALSQGRTPAEIRARIRYFAERPGAWGAGALSYVLTCPDYVGAPVDDWPPPSQAWGQMQQVAAASQRRHCEESRVAEQRQTEDSELAQLEFDFGPGVDSLTPEQQLQLLPPAYRFTFTALLRKQQNPAQSKLLRPELLKAFAQKAATN